MVTGSPGGRKIINTVLQTILNVVDHEMNVQEAVDAPRIHHQWLPDRILYERVGFSPDTLALLEKRGHAMRRDSTQGVVEAIVFDAERNLLEGGVDRRAPDGGAAGLPRLEQRAPTSAGRAGGPPALPAVREPHTR
jgi:gamma-glutamyltranspeptidase/glutathione hydrolase